MTEHIQSPIPNPQSLRVGLLGGSFNPAHAGHVHLSRQALKRLQLDAVWWLVTPKNPLKKQSELADYAQRLQHARQVAAVEKRIHVSDIEAWLNTRYTVDTLAALKRQFPRTEFVWLMGADNLAQFHKWRRWTRIFQLVPVAVFDRAPFSHHALRAPAALRFANYKKHNNGLYGAKPAWAYVMMPRHAESATRLRTQENTWKKPETGA